MPPILIGSRALALVSPQCLNRKPLDFDFMCSLEEYEKFMKDNSHKINLKKQYKIDGDDCKADKMIVEGDVNLEFEIIRAGHSSEIFEKLVKESSDTLETKFGLVPNLDLLYSIKKSHRFLRNSPHFWKTAIDLKKMQSFGAEVKSEYEEFFKKREKETLNYKHPKLNVTKDKFFSDDNVPYQYCHDSIHWSQKHLDVPAYFFYKKEGSEVLSDKQKFFACDDQIKYYGAIEEVSTIALERAKIPYPNVMTDKQAWIFSLSKICSSITSGFFRSWCHDHIFEILQMYPEDYVDKFKKALADGVIKPFSGTKY